MGVPTGPSVGRVVIEAAIILAGCNGLGLTGNDVRHKPGRVNTVCCPVLRLTADTVVILVLGRSEASIIVMGIVAITRQEFARGAESCERAAGELGEELPLLLAISPKDQRLRVMKFTRPKE